MKMKEFEMHFAVLILLQCCFNLASCDICRIDRSSGSSETHAAANTTGDDLMTCPGPDDPPEMTSCCFYSLVQNESNPQNATDAFLHDSLTRCCPESYEQHYLFNFISDRVALIIVVSITAALLVVTVAVVVCCFWSRCPLYMMCRVKYRKDDIVAYASNDEETTNLKDVMPPEEKKGVTVYSLDAVKVTLNDDD